MWINWCVMIVTFPCRHSIKWPTVILDGMAWGLMMMSGVIPSQVNGMSFKIKQINEIRQNKTNQWEPSKIKSQFWLFLYFEYLCCFLSCFVKKYNFNESFVCMGSGALMTGTWPAGITSCLYWIPQVPFCPCRLANLSPIWGIRTERTCRKHEAVKVWPCHLTSQVSQVCAHPDFAELVALLIQGHHDLVHDARLTGPQKRAAVSLRVAAVRAIQLVVILWQCHRLPNDHVLARNTDARCDESIVIQLVIDGMSHPWAWLEHD